MLGECFSLLENRNETVDLPARNSDGKGMTLHIPDDLFIIGTMNLIDQSIEQVDFALRRRFFWVPCLFDAEVLINAAEAKWQEQKIPLSWDRVESDFRLRLPMEQKHSIEKFAQVNCWDLNMR